jgi:hypothetical protein
MGIVKISEELHEEVRRASVTMVRSINAQAEFWMKMGMLAELNPGLSYTELLRQLLQQAVLPPVPVNDAGLLSTTERMDTERSTTRVNG